MIRIVLFLLLGFALLADSANADRRKYAWTYQYATIAPEASELELYQTTKVKENSANAWEYRIELEHGLTDNWDFSVYQIFAQTEGQSLRWDAFQLRTRYKLARPGQFPMNPLLYLEYNRKLDFAKQNKLEAKLILGRNFDRWNLAINPVYEFFWAPGEPVHEIGTDIGLSYEVSFKLSLGIESISRIKYLPSGGGDEKGSYLGPVVSFANGTIYYTFGYIFGLTDESDNSRIRFLIGVDL